jgi:hypothetical protein
MGGGGNGSSSSSSSSSSGGGGGGGGGGGAVEAVVVRWAAERTEEAHDVLLDALGPLKGLLGRLPFGAVAV